MEIFVKTILPILLFVVTIYKTYHDVFPKKHINDMEQLNKYFSKEKFILLEKEYAYIQDMACQTVSFLRGHKFQDIAYLLRSNNLSLFDLKGILRLKKVNVLIVDEKIGKLRLNPNFDDKQLLSLKKIYYTKIWFSWFILIFYVLFLIFIFVWIGNKIPFVMYMFLMITALSIVQIPLMDNMDKIKSAEYFRKNYLDKLIKSNQGIILSE